VIPLNLNTEDIIELTNFILKNDNLDINTLNQVKKILKNKENNEYQITEKETKLLIQLLIKLYPIFTSHNIQGSNLNCEKKLLEYIIDNKIPFNKQLLKEKSLHFFQDTKLLEKVLKEIICFDSKNEQSINNIITLYKDTLSTPPTIKNYNSIFQYLAEEKWQEHKEKFSSKYQNISIKISTELIFSDTFEQALNNLEFFEDLKTTLDKKYLPLHEAMLDYYHFFHESNTLSEEKIESSQNIISELSSLYITKSKENYKKEMIFQYHQWLKQFFILRIENPYITNQLLYQQKLEKFINLYKSQDKNIYQFLYNIEEKYKTILTQDEIWKIFNHFILQNTSNIKHIFPALPYFLDYEKYENAKKLINRLNNNYIAYNSPELNHYKEIISYHNEKKEYIYTGRIFNKEEIQEYNNYRKKVQIFEIIKKEIHQKIDSIEVTEIKHNNCILDKLDKKLPFTDEYYKFNINYILKNFTLDDLIKTLKDEQYIYFYSKPFSSKESFNHIYNLLIKNGLIWFILLNNKLKIENNFNHKTIIDIISNIDNITNLQNRFNANLNNLNELMLLHKISKYTDNSTLAILGLDLIKTLCKNNTSYTNEKIINASKELICQMTKKNKSTIPYITGNTPHYNYSIYDSQDENILLTGIQTNACFKINGACNDFLHYCALNQNGFVLKITNNYGKFIARASGIRNGNCIIFNQLRTIFDKENNHYKEKNNQVTLNIIKTFQQACEDIITNSKNNKEEKQKIDFVFITKSYIMNDYESELQKNTTKKITKNYVNIHSKNWIEFIKNTKYLIESNKNNPFNNDYHKYPLICIASSKKIDNITPKNLKLKDNKPIYERKRNKIEITNTLNLEIQQKINKIQAIHDYLTQTNFIPINIPTQSTIFTGDNWYIIYHNKTIIQSCVLEFDSKAKKEFEITQKIINNTIKNKNENQLNIEEINNQLDIIQKKNSNPKHPKTKILSKLNFFK